VRRLTDHKGFNLGARRVTISTVGIVPAIRRLTREGTQVGLAVSLHAPTDELRESLVPLARKYPLPELMSACRDYAERTGRRVTFEYALIEGLNDSRKHAARLASLLEGLLCHVNLIPLNPVPDSPWQPSSADRVRAFHQALRGRGVNATTRLRRGMDIEAGCGQLRSRRLRVESTADCV
jgi:23S rRNA (adenine2503-C2)-methyltransferase